MGIGTASGTPAPARSSWQFRNSVKGPTFPTGCWSGARAERTLISVVATSYLLGVSTRRMEKLVDQLGITRLSKSHVSVMAKDLDAQVKAFRTRPLDAGPYTFIAADALTMKVREAGRVVNVACLVATGVNADGHREILGLDVCSAESHAGWLTFFRGLTARGLSGVSLVTSDAHPAWSRPSPRPCLVRAGSGVGRTTMRRT